jgi:hypothetical protein
MQQSHSTPDNATFLKDCIHYIGWNAEGCHIMKSQGLAAGGEYINVIVCIGVGCHGWA